MARECNWCGKEFRGTNSQKFCTKACSAEHTLTVSRGRTHVKKCRQCGKWFEAKGRLICSEECKKDRLDRGKFGGHTEVYNRDRCLNCERWDSNKYGGPHFESTCLDHLAKYNIIIPHCYKHDSFHLYHKEIKRTVNYNVKACDPNGSYRVAI